MRPVDFFIVGQPKSGTTALATFLDEHPEISMAVPKEPAWMASDLIEESVAAHGDTRKVSVASESDYAACFAAATADQLRGDASTWNLYSRSAASRIHEHNAEARIVALIREPVAMIASLHQQYVNESVEDLADLREALSAEPARAAGRDVPPRAPVPSLLLYRERTRFREQLERYFDVFGRDRVLVALTTDLRDDPDDLYGRILTHLDVADTGFRPEFRGVHESKAPRSTTLNAIVRSDAVKRPVRAILGNRRYTELQKRFVEPALMKDATRDPVSADIREDLQRELLDEVLYVSDLLGRDLVTEWGY
ncbi:sulfotransferase [Demequina salsinemoris]|uniref:sulfotransferase n=1 Tax=Demequina salsinemoris TaxID=577470 RepID=UPI00078510AF|nr:sulfotransferase [Demequina salsinemoris]